MVSQPCPKINGLAVIYRNVSELVAHATNARTHSTKQIAQIARSIETFGWTNPILIDENGNVLAGHGRLAEARKLGLASVPTICLSHMTKAQKRAYIIADNRLSEMAGWDRAVLAGEFKAIQLLDPEFCLDSTGFELGEIEIYLDNECSSEEDEVQPADRSRPPVSCLGDVWQFGDHRLICGNALDPVTYEILLEGHKAQMVISDCPFNVPMQGHATGQGKVKHREFVMASGEMSREEFTAFLTTACQNLIKFSALGSIHFLYMDWRHLAEMFAATSIYTEFKGLIVWNKSNAGMGTFYRSKHELIFAMKNGLAKHINNFGLGDKGRYRTNVWDYPGVNSWGQDRDAELAMHPTVKPVAMIADAIKDCSRKGGLVLDAFCGSGTILLAAEATGRRARTIELDPYYVDVAVRRWQDKTGRSAIHAGTGATFAEREKGRAQ